MKYYIGVDLGTSAVKLLLMDQEGQVVNIVSREYPLSFPHPGWSEQNPEDWWEQSKEGIKELISKIDATEVIFCRRHWKHKEKRGSLKNWVHQRRKKLSLP